MAMSRNTLMGIGLATFGVSLMIASGPFGAAFGAAMLYSVLAVAAFASLLHLASSANVSVGFWPSFHSFYQPFTRPFWPTHTRNFVPRGVAARQHTAPTHTSRFVPGGVAAKQPTAPTHMPTRTFTPAAARTMTAPTTRPVHTQSQHTRTFIPGGRRS